MRRTMQMLLAVGLTVLLAVIPFAQAPKQSALLLDKEVQEMRESWGQGLLLPTRLSQTSVRSAKVLEPLDGTEGQRGTEIVVDMKLEHGFSTLTIYERITEDESMPLLEGKSNEEIGRMLGHIPIHGFANSHYAAVQIGDVTGYYHYYLDNYNPKSLPDVQYLDFVQDGLFVSLSIGASPSVYSKEQFVELASSFTLYKAKK